MTDVWPDGAERGHRKANHIFPAAGCQPYPLLISEINTKDIRTIFVEENSSRLLVVSLAIQRSC